jgi:hypothetical protein
MKYYLYGLTIHSIQGYIFQTNKLKEIAGASELVEQICTTEFAKMIVETENFDELKKDIRAIRNAAGNIRYLFDETQLELCKKVVREFPKTVLELAPGVQISQAVIEIAENALHQEQQNKFKELEDNLTFQRSNPIRPVDLGYMAVNRSRRTGLPSVERKPFKGEFLINDQATKNKLDLIDPQNKSEGSRVNIAFFGKDVLNKQVPVDVEKIVSTLNPNYSWLAVIHADGNNMGQALRNLGEEKVAQDDYSKASKIFSEIIDDSTKSAAKTAFYATLSKDEIDKAETISFRPIIVGGDDLTVVCRADFALKYTMYFLDEFKKQTSENFSKQGFTTNLKNGLTACAGIAYIKVNYPFHYAVDLAEKLCTHAKKDAKKKLDKNGQVPSCLMFHKVQDSFVENYEDIIERELTAQASDIQFDFGPYYLDQEPKIETLAKQVSVFSGKDGNAIKSSLRQWLTDLHENKGMAEQRMNRMLSVGNNNKLGSLKLKENKGVIDKKSPVYDWLTILSINQNDNNNGDD